MIQLNSGSKNIDVTFENNYIDTVFSAGSIIISGEFSSSNNLVNIKNNVFTQSEASIKSFISTFVNAGLLKDNLIETALSYTTYFMFSKAQVISELNSFSNLLYYTIYKVADKTSTFLEKSSIYNNFKQFSSY